MYKNIQLVLKSEGLLVYWYWSSRSASTAGIAQGGVQGGIAHVTTHSQVCCSLTCDNYPHVHQH